MIRRLVIAQRRETHLCTTDKIARSLNSKVEKKHIDNKRVASKDAWLPRDFSSNELTFRQELNLLRAAFAV